MKIIISPAKKMKVDTDSFSWQELPVFLPRTVSLLGTLRGMSYSELKSLWKCSDAIASLNAKRLAEMDLYHHLTPAILAYEGIQYQYMAPGVFSDLELEYIQQHLRILSGFYGMLRPFDGVSSYRLEMQAKLRPEGKRDLYAFWGDSIANKLFSETSCIVNLASREYSLCVSAHLVESIRFITCVFGQEAGGKVIEKGTMCKMARGEMVRFLASNQITDPEEIKDFSGLGYQFASKYSDQNTFTFLQTAKTDRE